MITSRYMLDTNICIYIRQQRPEAVLRRFRSLHPGEAVISTITYGELCYGVAKSSARDRAQRLLGELLTLLPVQSLPQEVGLNYGVIRSDLQRTGQIIGNNDLWIAAHARTSRLILVTNNEREFSRIPGLNIENWASVI